MPSWSPDGNEIYFISPDSKLMSARVREHDGGFAVDVAQPLFPVIVRNFTGLTRVQYTTHDGKTFVVNSLEQQYFTSTPITIVQNWQAR
jgi:Tol biopolymer transport system component